MAPRGSKGKFRRAVLDWHRRLGLVSLALVILLVVTGLMLNHNDALGLDQRPIRSPLLLSWYGLKPAAEPISFDAAGRRITSWGGAIFLDDQIVDESPSPVVGAVRLDDGIVFAVTELIAVIDARGLVSRRIDADQLPGALLALGRSPAGKLTVRTKEGCHMSRDLASWRPCGDRVVWSRPSPPSAELTRRVMQGFSEQGLPLGRILLDLHSGRILGGWGPYLMDAAAICLFLLTLSGFYNWYTGRRK